MSRLESAPCDVVCVGNALVDHLAFAGLDVLASLGLPPGSMTLVDIATTERIAAIVGEGRPVPGGTVTNTAVGIASLGGRPAFIGAVATDELGDRFAADLESEGVHAVLERFPADPTSSEAATGRCFVVVTPDAERTMATALGVGSRLDRSGIDDSLVAEAQIVYFDGYALDLPDADGLVTRVVDAARRGKTKVALGLSDALVVGRHHRELTALVSGVVSLLFANESEALALTGAGDIDGAVASLRGSGLVTVVTCGAAGAVLASDDELIRVPADEVPEVVDVTGAGDLFAAGVCFALTRGEDLATAGRLGALAAGEVIGHLGARPEVSLAELGRARALLIELSCVDRAQLR